MTLTKQQNFTKGFLKADMPQIMIGDTVKLHQKIKEGEKERIQIFEGVVIAQKHGRGVSGSMIIRKIIDGVGVEKMVPLHSPNLVKIEIVAHGKTRRAKLYFLRDKIGKKSKLKRQEIKRTKAPQAPETKIEQPSEIVES